jgi:MFS family permease
MLLFGKIYTFYSTKVVFLSAIVLFEIGSALCGAAPSSKAFIVGRAIAGWGSAGIFGGVIVIMVYTVCIFSCALHPIPIISGVI